MKETIIVLLMIETIEKQSNNVGCGNIFSGSVLLIMINYFKGEKPWSSGSGGRLTTERSLVQSLPFTALHGT